MKWFKSIWLKMRKSNGLPGPGHTLISLDKQIVQETVKKPRKPRTKKVKKDE